MLYCNNRESPIGGSRGVRGARISAYHVSQKSHQFFKNLGLVPCEEVEIGKTL